MSKRFGTHIKEEKDSSSPFIYKRTTDLFFDTIILPSSVNKGRAQVEILFELNKATPDQKVQHIFPVYVAQQLSLFLAQIVVTNKWEIATSGQNELKKVLNAQKSLKCSKKS